LLGEKHPPEFLVGHRSSHHTQRGNLTRSPTA
jgi:hypothetical protein